MEKQSFKTVLNPAIQRTYNTDKKSGKRGGLFEYLPFYLLSLALLLLVFEQFRPALIEQARNNLLSAMAPAYRLLSKPIQSTEAMVEHIIAWRNLTQENHLLRHELVGLQEMELAYQRLLIENQRLSNLLNYDRAQVKRYISAPVIGSGGAYTRSLLVAAGQDRGIQSGMIAVDGKGVLGRVVSVQANTARILLINDLNSHLPAMIEGNSSQNNNSISSGKRHFIMAGDNDDLGHILYLPQHSHLQLGMRIVTSGDGGGLPQGLLLGHLVRLKDDEQVWRVQYAADVNHVNMVQILEY